ncbi:MAG TPA: hypothetical protein DCP92_16235 [Nitrospiraceae bacterium]|nr:hypothetical protein [Nitrospiraceae bacterium]
MAIEPCEMIYFRVMPDTSRYQGRIASSNEETIVLEPTDDTPLSVGPGKHIILSGEHFDYCTEVLTMEGANILLKPMWKEKRGYFRVDDIFPVRIQKITEKVPLKKSAIISRNVLETSDADQPVESVSPKLWKMLNTINTKLNMLLERLNLERAGLTTAENKAVNLSATGIRLSVQDRPEIADVVEVKMLLPTTPPVGVETYGKVVRVRDTDSEAYEVSLQFTDMEDELRDEIIRYALNRQRELMHKQRQQRGNNG